MTSLFNCSVCLKDVDFDCLWLPDNMDTKQYCFGCAPDDAVRAKDLMPPTDWLARRPAGTDNTRR